MQTRCDMFLIKVLCICISMYTNVCNNRIMLSKLLLDNAIVKSIEAFKKSPTPNRLRKIVAMSGVIMSDGIGIGNDMKTDIDYENAVKYIIDNAIRGGSMVANIRPIVASNHQPNNSNHNQVRQGIPITNTNNPTNPRVRGNPSSISLRSGTGGNGQPPDINPLNSGSSDDGNDGDEDKDCHFDFSITVKEVMLRIFASKSGQYVRKISEDNQLDVVEQLFDMGTMTLKFLGNVRRMTAILKIAKIPGLPTIILDVDSPRVESIFKTDVVGTMIGASLPNVLRKIMGCFVPNMSHDEKEGIIKHIVMNVIESLKELHKVMSLS